MLSPEQIAQLRGDAGLSPTPPEKGTEDILAARRAAIGMDTEQTAEPSTFDKLSSSPFKASGDENLITGTAKALGNTPASALNLGGNVASAVIHPVDTVMNIGKTLVGGGEALGRKIGVAGSDVKRPEEEQFGHVADFFKSRYGSVDKLQKTAIEDPVGLAADISAIFTGGGSALAKAGEISKVSSLAQAGNTIAKTGQVIEPLGVVSKTARGVKNLVGKALPDSTELQKSNVAKALNLTPADLGKISANTGNEAAQYLLSKKLLKNNSEETASALETEKQSSMQKVRDEVNNVKKEYTPEEVPNVQKGLDVILKGVEGVPGLEDVVAKIENLGFKNKYTLNDIQKAKEFIDENSNIYSKTGDVKTASSARGLDNIRKDLRGFIEKEVSTNTGGKVNIQQLNNDVQTSHALKDAIVNREVRDIPKAYSPITDIILGGAGFTVNPFLGMGLVVGKHILQSPTFRIKFARLLAKEPVATAKAFAKENTTGKLSPTTQARLQKIIDTAQENLPYTEAVSNVLDKKSQEENQ